MEIQLANIWVAAGVILGFQVTWFTWRVSREVKVGGEGDLTWLPPADIVNLVSMVVAAVGVFILPTLGIVGTNVVKHFFAFAVLLFVGYPFALAGHYDMYNRSSIRSYKYFTLQEQIAIGVIGGLAVVYIVFAFIFQNI